MGQESISNAAWLDFELLFTEKLLKGLGESLPSLGYTSNTTNF